MSVPDWHEKILHEALELRKKDPTFRFNLRNFNVGEADRLGQGYWFTGNDSYLFFAPFTQNDQNNKTKTIGFVIRFDKQGEPTRCYLEIVFGTTKDAGLRKFYEDTVADLGGFKKAHASKFQRNYKAAEPLQCFQEFLADHYPRIQKRIHSEKLDQQFQIPEKKFKIMLERVNSIREKTPPATSQKKAPSSNNGNQTSGSVRARNLILYGPPGTGKTYWLSKQFAEYEDEPSAVDDATWLQETLSGYGWRAVIAAVLADLGKPARVPQIRDHQWLMAKARQRGRTPKSCQATLWGYLQEHTPESSTTVKANQRRAPFIFSKQPSGEWELEPDWKEQDQESADLLESLIAGPKSAHGVIRRYRTVTFHPSFSYEDFVRGIRPVNADEGGAAQFRCVDGVFKVICDEARANPAKRYALFIDEINRANIAKVFGELITLIEPDKRALFDANGQLLKGMAVHLPGGDGLEVAEVPFGVPENLDIYGTMNTADRSIALLDIALRRRFEFLELAPDYTTINRSVEGVQLGKLLERINDRLEYLLDRDHRIGHAYLMRVNVLADLQNVFATQIIPLLQEYFFDDLGKVAMVLTTWSNSPKFISCNLVKRDDIFYGASPMRIAAERYQYAFTHSNTWTTDSFVGIYTDKDEVLAPSEEDTP